MPSLRCGEADLQRAAGAVAADEHREVVFAGGSSMPPGDGAAAYDPTVDGWEALDDVPLPFESAVAVSTGDRLVVVGPDTPGRSDGYALTLPGS